MPEQDELPVWAAADVFPDKPSDSDYGSLSGKGRWAEFDRLEDLEAHVARGRDSVAAVWTPEVERTVPPEAVPALLAPLRRRFTDVAAADLAHARRNVLVFGLVLAWAVVAAIGRRMPPLESQSVGLAGFLLFVLGLIPLYEAWKAGRLARALNADSLESEEQEARFEYWLDRQRVPVTIALVALMALAGLVQIWIGVPGSVEAAGLVKPRYAAGEWWRLLTAPFLHGNPLHWVLNAAALWYLGRRTESLARWPHLAMVFLVAMVAGGTATARYLPETPSIGASGGVLGVLGMLMAFELLHQKLVPRSARRRLAAGVLATFAIGFVGYKFIDNAAHAGGLLAGLVYGVVVFPKSGSVRRPRAMRIDVVAGGLALGVLTASALLATGLMLAS